MSNQLLINGQLETFNQPVASWQPIPQSRLRVEWGANDVVFLDGSTWTVTKPTSNRTLRQWNVRVRISFFNNTFAEENYSCWSFETPTNFLTRVCGSTRGAYVRVIGGISFGGTDSCGFYLGQSLGICGNTTFWHVLTEWSSVHTTGMSLVSISEIGTPRNCSQTETVVSSNLGNTRRWGDLNPQITTVTSGCVLRVTFTDGTTQDLSYPNCPTVEWAFNCPEACNIANRIVNLLPQ